MQTEVHGLDRLHVASLRQHRVRNAAHNTIRPGSRSAIAAWINARGPAWTVTTVGVASTGLLGRMTCRRIRMVR